MEVQNRTLTIVRFSTSVTALLCHPLLVQAQISDEGMSARWACLAVPLISMGGFTCRIRDIEDEPGFRLSLDDLIQLRSATRDQVNEWLLTKGLEIENPPCAIYDPRSNHMYPIDMIASRHGQAFLIILLHTRRRIPRTRHAEMLQYAREIHGVCIEQYAMSPTTILVNVYFKGQAEGGGTGVSAISRPTPSSYRSSSSSSEGGVAARRLRPMRVEMA